MTWWQLGHAVLVLVHAAAATIGFAAGVVLLWKGRGLRVHRPAVIIMAGVLVPSMALGWPDFGTPNKIIFSALFVLALVLVLQAVRAGRIRQREIADGRALAALGIGPDFVHTIGFNVIALVAGATVVPALRIGGGVVAALISVGLAVAVAHLLVERRRRQVRERVETERARDHDPAAS